MRWVSLPTGRPCGVSSALYWLNSTTNGRSGGDTSRLHSLRSTKLYRRRLSLNQLPPKQHQKVDALLHHLTGRDPVWPKNLVQQHPSNNPAVALIQEPAADKQHSQADEGGHPVHLSQAEGIVGKQFGYWHCQ